MASSWMKNPTNKDGLLLKQQMNQPIVFYVRIARAASLLSRAAGGALSSVRVKKPGAHIELRTLCLSNNSTSNRADAVLLARLRAGRTPLLKAYANLLDPSADTLCPLCKEEPQTIKHWQRRCPRLDSTRQNIFGSPSPPLKVLTTDPERVLALARVTLG